jgi:hypothetical protein
MTHKGYITITEDLSASPNPEFFTLGLFSQANDTGIAVTYSEIPVLIGFLQKAIRNSKLLFP